MNVITENLVRRWNINYLAPIQRHLTSFWDWWSSELLALLPDNMQQSIVSSSERLFVQISGTELRVFRGSIDRMQEVACYETGAVDAHPTAPEGNTSDTVLLLPPRALLRSTITLPAATEENLRDVLSFEMDQLTPFTVDQVYYDYSICARNAAERSIDVEVFVAPRHAIDELLASLSNLNLYPDIVTTKAGGGGIHAVNLMPAGSSRRRANSTRWLNTGLVAVCGLLLLAVFSVPLLQKRTLIAELEPQLAVAMEAAKEGTRLRRNIEIMATGAQELLRKKESQAMLMELISEMTRIVPDDTWLARLDVTGNEIQIQGNSKAAASLIGLVESSAVFDNAQFRSPVTQVPRTDVERFHLSATWGSEEED